MFIQPKVTEQNSSHGNTKAHRDHDRDYWSCDGSYQSGCVIITTAAGHFIIRAGCATADLYPVPGPFLAIVDAAGKPTDPGVMANAVASWAGPKLATFLLCFQPATGAPERKITWSALDNVSRVLKAKGAVAIVVRDAVMCVTSPSMSVAGKPHVEILGVIRLQE